MDNSTILPRSARSKVMSFNAQSSIGFRRARQPYVDVGDHTFVDGIVVGDPTDRLAHLEAFKFGKKADMP